MKILIVEDEPTLREFLESLFLRRNHQVRAFNSATAALDVLPAWQPDVLLCDLDLAGGHAEDLAWLVARVHTGLARRARVILMSCDPHRLALSCRGADDVLLKPFATEELATVVEASS